MDNTAARRQWRRHYVEKFLAEIGVTHDMLAQPTQKNLDDWARQVQLVTDQPSANWDNAILQLCKAVESELACSLGRIKGLEFLASADTLGTQAHRLKNFKWEAAMKQRLAAQGFKPGFVSSTLPSLLFRLANLRSDTNSAHGGVEIRTATTKEAEQARDLVKTLLKSLLSKRKE